MTTGARSFRFCQANVPGTCEMTEHPWSLRPSGITLWLLAGNHRRLVMSEAVIVATARTPIGRAGKGSLKDVRPDDLAAFAIRAALDKVPGLDPAQVDDLYLGCAEPRDEHGGNMARRVAVQLGYDHLPAVTVNRFCASSVQTARMAFHAIKAGEGDVFVSAGVECV